MAKSNKPRVIIKPVAGHYEGINEKIVEFEGGLISFIRLDDGTLAVDLYNLDKNVEVRIAYEPDYDPKVTRMTHGICVKYPKSKK